MSSRLTNEDKKYLKQLLQSETSPLGQVVERFVELLYEQLVEAHYEINENEFKRHGSRAFETLKEEMNVAILEEDI